MTGLGCGACVRNAALQGGGLRGGGSSGGLAVVLGLLAVGAIGFTVYGFRSNHKRR